MPWPFSSGCDDHGCAPINPNAPSTAGLVLSLGPFLATFAAVFVVAERQIFWRLARVHDARDGEDNVLPSHAPPSLRQAHAEHGRKSFRSKVAAVTFSITVALAAVLGELILCEIAGIVSPRAREIGLRVTVPTLLWFLVGVIPFLEIQSAVAGMGWRFQRTSKGRFPRFAWGLQLSIFAGWLVAFWSLGALVPLGHDEAFASLRSSGDLASGGWTRACLERIGVIGIALMAMLSGFAAASTPWYTFGGATGRKMKPVLDVDISRKQAGLDATNEMLLTKRHRLQALERKASTTQSQNSSRGIMGKMLGNIRGGSDEGEMRGLRVEIAGLETMEANLSSNLGLMRSRHAASVRASTTLGRVLTVPHHVFSLYCLYRIIATTSTTIRRAYSPAAAFSSTDPINRFLGLLARHWDPMLDQDAWARQISFLLSGVILAASASSATQTFHLFARFAPGLLFQAQANLALITGQVLAAYVISAALLLRSNLPSEMGSAVSDALRSALDPRFVDGWFEGWFLVASAATVAGLWVSRKITGDGEDWDDYGVEEAGQKRS